MIVDRGNAMRGIDRVKLYISFSLCGECADHNSLAVYRYNSDPRLFSSAVKFIDGARSVSAFEGFGAGELDESFSAETAEVAIVFYFFFAFFADHVSPLLSARSLI
jgi:hypothetical protein